MQDIQVKNLKFGYTSDLVVDNLNLSVEKGELIAILGENGSGKSTLLKLILGELKPQEGEIKLLDKKVSEISSFKKIGYVPQVQNFNAVAFPITVLELVVLNLYEDFGFVKIPKKKHKDRAREVLVQMGLGPYINAPFNELSGGLKQRTMIARAMINDPEILILDEPTAGVDTDSKANFLKVILDLNKNEKITIIVVTHELDVIKENITVDKVYVMNEGRLING